MKNFILKIGELLIAIAVWVGIIITLSIGLPLMTLSPLLGLAQILMGILAIVAFAFFVYLLIDIRDNLKQLNDTQNKQ